MTCNYAHNHMIQIFVQNKKVSLPDAKHPARRGKTFIADRKQQAKIRDTLFTE
jgi:hypothetical protein